jgi:hypothetical protein
LRILADQARSFDLLHRRSPCYNARYEVGSRWCHDPGAQHRLQSSGFHIAHAAFVRAIIRQAIFKTRQNIRAKDLLDLQRGCA